jgi:hypothetical protein
MKRKLPIILVASSAIMLAASTIGSTKATLTYMSDNYLAQIDIKSIGVTLTENGNDVSWRDYKHKDDDWSEATGVLLGDMLKNAGDEKLILDKKYDEKLAVKNSGSIDEYVRVTVQHYWADKETGDKLSKLDPSKIQIDFTNDGWTEDESAETTERNVFYYNSILKKGQTSTDFTDKISISGDIAAIAVRHHRLMITDLQPSLLPMNMMVRYLCWRQLLMQYRHIMQRTQLRVRGVLM